MTRSRLSRSFREFVNDQLVDEKLDHKFDTVAQLPAAAAIRWQCRNYAGPNTRLHTAYGKLEVCRDLGGWTVMRDGTPLVHARSSRAAIFTTQRAAKAAGLIHLQDGFGEVTPSRDGLWWDERPLALHPTPQPHANFPVDPSLSDDHEFGTKRLAQLLKDSRISAHVADQALICDLEVHFRSWQLVLPTWTKRAHGSFELNTPYGLLVVSRLFGWTVERDGVPLCWTVFGGKVIFDMLEHAKISALLHAKDIGWIRFPDGTSWINTPTIFNEPNATP